MNMLQEYDVVHPATNVCKRLRPPVGRYDFDRPQRSCSGHELKFVEAGRSPGAFTADGTTQRRGTQ